MHVSGDTRNDGLRQLQPQEQSLRQLQPAEHSQRSLLHTAQRQARVSELHKLGCGVNIDATMRVAPLRCSLAPCKERKGAELTLVSYKTLVISPGTRPA